MLKIQVCYLQLLPLRAHSNSVEQTLLQLQRYFLFSNIINLFFCQDLTRDAMLIFLPIFCSRWYIVSFRLQTFAIFFQSQDHNCICHPCFYQESFHDILFFCFSFFPYMYFTNIFDLWSLFITKFKSQFHNFKHLLQKHFPSQPLWWFKSEWPP